MSHKLDPLLRPRSVAVVGASAAPGSLTGNVMRNLRRGGTASVVAVNPKYDEIDGLPCYPSLAELPEPVDCAFIGVRAELVPGLLAGAAEAGTRAVAVNAAGFGAGGAEGRALLGELQRIAGTHDIALCGPNNIGFYNVRDRVGCWTLADVEFRSGAAALITQSGTAAMVLAGDPLPIGLSYVITCGDEAVLTAADYLDYVIRDDDVDVVLLYLETIRDPGAFRAAALRAAAAGKRVIVLKVGRTEVGARAVSAHTGGLAGDDDVYEALFRQTGVVRVRDMDEMVQLAHLCAAYPQGPRAPGFVPVTMSGGIAALAADTAADARFQLPVLEDATRQAITAANPALPDPQNPLDAWGLGWDPETFPGVLDALAGQPDVGTIGVLLDAPASGRAETVMARELAPMLQAARRDGVTPLIVNTNGQGTTDPEVIDTLARAGIPCLLGVTESVKAIAAWSRWPEPEVVAVDPVASVTVAGRRYAEEEAMLSAAGLPMVESRLVGSAGEAVTAATALGYPVVMKAVHPEAPHKSDAGLVRLGLRGEEEVARTFEDLVATMRVAGLHAEDADIVVQPWMEPGLEMILGCRNVGDFGTLLVVGLGGIYVEVLGHAASRLGPVDRGAVEEMVAELGLGALFRGVRGESGYDLAAFTQAAVDLTALSSALHEDVAAIELNPVRVYRPGDGVVALDSLVEYRVESRDED